MIKKLIGFGMFYSKVYKFLFLFLYTLIYADTNTTLQSEKNYIDKAHTIVSEKIVKASENVDTKLSTLLKDNNTTKFKQKIDTNEIALYEKSIDAFYNNQKFSQETEETYVSIRLDSFFQSKENVQYNATLNAQIPLVRSQKYFHFFINKVTNNFTDKEPQDTATVGVNYFTHIFYTLKSKYTVATHGLNPFVQARYFLIFDFFAWKIEPIQTFTYSKNEKFEEESNLYFDKQITSLSLFRLSLGRKTRQSIDGIDYMTSLAYFYSPKKNTGINLTQSFSGNTRYQYLEENQDIKIDSGITNYVTSITWRKNIYRKWLFYQVTPSVSFHKKYDYDPNYTLLFLLELYFGKLDY